MFWGQVVGLIAGDLWEDIVSETGRREGVVTRKFVGVARSWSGGWERGKAGRRAGIFTHIQCIRA